MRLSEPTSDGGQPTESQVVYEVLSKYTENPRFLQNVGVMHRPLRSAVSRLTAELQTERKASAELRVVVTNQRNQIDQIASEAQQIEEKHAALCAKVEALLTVMYQ